MGQSAIYKRIATLAWPLFIGQIAVIANGIIDTVMVSRFSADDLAGLALATSIYVSIFIGLSGVLQALLPIVGQLFGAGQHDKIGAEVKQAMWLAFFLSVIGGIAMWFAPHALVLAGTPPELIEKASDYLHIEMLALPATLGFRLYSALNTAISQPKMVMIIQLIGLGLKIPLNAVFIFGFVGMPALGANGCAIATVIITWLMLLICWIGVCTAPYYKNFNLFHVGFVSPQWASQKRLLTLGIPMGMSYFIEVTGFTLITVFIAKLGATVVAAHQITANIGATLYMLPLAIASATSTLVAQNIGAQQWHTAKLISHSGIRFALICSVITGAAVYFLRHLIIQGYTPDPAILVVASTLFLFVAFYQFFDAIQVTTAFVLRAYQIAFFPTLIYAIGLWGIGLGGGYLIGYDPFDIMPALFYGAPGFWLANSLSLAFIALILTWYLKRIQRSYPQDNQVKPL